MRKLLLPLLLGTGACIQSASAISITVETANADTLALLIVWGKDPSAGTVAILDNPCDCGEGLTGLFDVQASDESAKVLVDVSMHPACPGWGFGASSASISFTFASGQDRSFANASVGFSPSVPSPLLQPSSDGFGAQIVFQPVVVTCLASVADVSGDTEICPGGSADITVSVTGGTPPYTVTLDNDAGTLTGSSPFHVSVNPGTTTTYHVISGHDAQDCPVTSGASATVKVLNDDSPPVITCPGDQTTAATSRGGVVVTFAATATDHCPGSTVVCAPHSGSTFPIGTTPVTCIAMDGSNNRADCGFSVHVKSAAEQISDLVNKVNGLPGVPAAIKNALVVKLDAALKALNKGNSATACAMMLDFIDLCGSQLGKKLETTDASALIDLARQIRNVIGCP